jgi:thymidylate synthase ThyX
VAPYLSEKWTEAEEAALRPHFTNLSGPAFAVVNLPTAVTAALFARSARSPHSVRRLFLKEFAAELVPGATGQRDADPGVEPTSGYDRVFYDFGSDDVAALAPLHLVVEQVSLLGADALARNGYCTSLDPAGAPVAYESRMGGRYRYHREPELLSSKLGTRYVGEMDQLFEVYASLLPTMEEHLRTALPRASGASDFDHLEAIRRTTLGALRGLLPAGATTNVALSVTAAGLEPLLVDLASAELPEVRGLAQLLAQEARKVVPELLRRFDDPERGGHAVAHRSDARAALRVVAANVTPTIDLRSEIAGDVVLLDSDPDAEVKLVASVLTPVTGQPEHRVLERVRTLSSDERLAILAAGVGERRARWHRPGISLEAVVYRFEVISDYATFLAIQSRAGTDVERQDLGPGHGYEMADEVADAGLGEAYEDAMALSADLYDLLAPEMPHLASYAVAQAHRVRYRVMLRGTGLVRVLERHSALCSGGERRVLTEMHRLISSDAGHHAIAALMRFGGDPGSVSGTAVGAKSGGSVVAGPS